jgi:hypothetical protein
MSANNKMRQESPNMTNSARLKAMVPSVVVSGFLGLLLLFVNSLPRVQCFEAKLSLCKAHYGWPKETKINTILQTTNYEDYREPRYSLSHLFGIQQFQVQSTQRSEYASASNIAFSVSVMLLSTVTTRAITMKKLSLRSLFAMVTSAGIIAATFTWNCFI